MAQRLVILVGTMTGTADLVAEEVSDVIMAQGVTAEVVPMDGLDAGVFKRPDTAFLICTSTYGQGDVPDNAQALFGDLERHRPDLSGVAYGVIALAVPVFDHHGRVVAALNSSSHSGRMTRTKLIRGRLAMLQHVSQQISVTIATVPGLSLSAQH